MMWQSLLAVTCAATLLQGYEYAGSIPKNAPVFEDRMVCPEGRVAFSHGSTLAAFPDGELFCAWYAGSREKGADVAILGSHRRGNRWSKPKVLVDTPGKSEGNPVLHLDDTGTLWLFYQTMYGSGEGPTQPGTGWTTCKIKVRTSSDRGRTWTEERVLVDELGYLTRSKLIVLRAGAWLLPIHDERNWSSRVLISGDQGVTWKMSDPIDCGLGFHLGNIEPALLEREDGSVLCYMRSGASHYKAWESVSRDGGMHWTEPREIEVPNPNAAHDLLRLASGNVLLALNPVPEGGRENLSVWLSVDDAEKWPVRRVVADGPGHASYPAAIQDKNGLIHMTFSRPDGGIKEVTFNEAWVWQGALASKPFKLANVLPPMIEPPEALSRFDRKPGDLPLAVGSFEEHVRVPVPEGTALPAEADGTRQPVVTGDTTWYAAEDGLYFQRNGGKKQRHADYGVGGPLATRITALAVDSKGTLWVGTPAGLSARKTDGVWESFRGTQGLPCEEITALAIDGQDRLWMGATRGGIQFRPYETGRQWFYRAGPRYLPDDHVTQVYVTPDGKTAWFQTEGGVGGIDTVTTTLENKAKIIEDRVNERHRRLGMVASCLLDDPWNPTAHEIHDNDNDGLWTAYHVGAMSLCYAATGDEAARASAVESMHALVMLQNVSGTPGLVARSVVPAEIGKTKNEQWRPTADGKLYWKSDTSSDEIDGHYFAFYTYWEHIAQFDPAERDLIIRQVRALTYYLVDNNYQLIDWDGQVTRWGFWNPERLNDSPLDYTEAGLNSLQMLSFLKVAHYITGDAKYKEHYDSLIGDHHYLNNVLLEKKVFPDSNNHSDNQLGYVAWYPILQLEWDPEVRAALHRAVRRHYTTLARDRSSFFYYVTATIDPEYVDLAGAALNLQEIPTDRRVWRTENSQRADVVFDPYVDRFGKRQLLHVLPADERNFEKWNANPYIPDSGGDGREEDDGAAYLLPYWMARFHGFLE